MIIPIYSDDLFELITLADIDHEYLQNGRVYRMLPEYSMEELGPASMVDTNPIFQHPIPIIDVRIDVFHRRRQTGQAFMSQTQSTYLGFALCNDELALRIRAAWAPGQVTSSARRLSWHLSI